MRCATPRPPRPRLSFGQPRADILAQLRICSVFAESRWRPRTARSRGASLLNSCRARLSFFLFLNGWLALPAGAVHAGRPRSTQLLRTEYCGLHSPMRRGRAPGTARIAATDARVAVARHHRAISPTTKVSIVSNTARHAKCAPIQPCMQQQQLPPPTAG